MIKEHLENKSLPVEVPKEKMYWRSGLLTTKSHDSYARVLMAASSEEAAKVLARHSLETHPEKYKIGSPPYELTLVELIIIAKARKDKEVLIYNENMEIIERWPTG